MIRFQCPECGKSMQAHESAVGRAAKCPKCGAVLEIPKDSVPVPPPAPQRAGFSSPPRQTPVPPPPPRMPDDLSVGAASKQAEMPNLDAILGVGPPPVAGERDANGEFFDPAAETFKRPVGAAAKSASTKPSAKKSSAGKQAQVAATDGKSNAKIRNFSIGAIAAGVIGLALFAIPYAGVAIGIVGALIGFYSVSQASSRRNSPMALALAGAALSVVAVAAGGFTTYRALQPPQVAVNTADAKANGDGSSGADADASDLAAGDIRRLSSGAMNAVITGAVADGRDPLNLATAAIHGVTTDPAKHSDRLAMARDVKAPAQRKGPVTLRLQGSPGDGSATSVTNDAPAAADSVPAAAAEQPVAAPAPKAPVHWAAADKGEAQGNDDIKVTITKATTGPLFFRIGNDELFGTHQTTSPLLHIFVKVQNNQTAGAIDYKGWITLPDAEATLTDNNGTEIKRFDLEQEVKRGTQEQGGPEKKVSVIASHPTATIGVSESHEDVVVFRMPAEGAEYVRLTLSGKPIGLSDDLHFQIPRSMIKEGETGNPLLLEGQ